jgi:hypothetical protein
MLMAALMAAPASAPAARPASESAAQPASEPASKLAAQPATSPPAPEFDMELRTVLTDAVIKKAVRDTIAEDPRPAPAAGATRDTRAFGAVTPYTRFGAAFDQAKVPDCLHPDALKLQPAMIGPIVVVGPYSLPWVIAAAVRGKCN